MNLSLNEAIDVAQNRPLRISMFTFGATHALIVVHARNEWMQTLFLKLTKIWQRESGKFVDF